MVTAHRIDGAVWRCCCGGRAAVAQESRDALQRTTDQAETQGEELEAYRQQNAELEIRLGTVQVIKSDVKAAERVLARQRTNYVVNFYQPDARFQTLPGSMEVSGKAGTFRAGDNFSLRSSFLNENTAFLMLRVFHNRSANRGNRSQSVLIRLTWVGKKSSWNFVATHLLRACSPWLTEADIRRLNRSVYLRTRPSYFPHDTFFCVFSERSELCGEGFVREGDGGGRGFQVIPSKVTIP